MAARSPQQRAAFTLVEMLIVMGIVAVLATMTLASYVSITRRNAREGAVEMVINTLRQARMSAVDSGRGAVVRIDPAARSLYGLSSKVEAAWHFEEVDENPDGEPYTPGARGMDGELCENADEPADTEDIDTADGVLGVCLDFDGSYYVDCDNYPVYDQTDGIRLEAYVWPQADDGTIIAKTHTDEEKGYSLALADGQLQATFYIQDPDEPEVSLSGDTLRRDRWSHVAAEFDGFEARLFVDETLVDSVSHEDGTNWEAPARLEPARRQRLCIGARRIDDDVENWFTGRIDEPRLLSVAGGDRRELPARVPLATSHAVVYFDGQGYLDREEMEDDEGVYVAVGDPYQRARLGDGLEEGDDTITLAADNPFPPGGGMVLVVSQNAEGETQFELVRYTEFDQDDALVLTDVEREHLGIRQGDDDHEQGSWVYFARVADVSSTGLVGRVRHGDEE